LPRQVGDFLCQQKGIPICRPNAVTKGQFYAVFANLIGLNLVDDLLVAVAICVSRTIQREWVIFSCCKNNLLIGRPSPAK
jgi:hypothetical protein